MFDLYPPVFIKDSHEKKEYIDTLALSFSALVKFPNQWNEYTALFFEQEMDRLLYNANLLYNIVNSIGLNRTVHSI
jgi:hypothetical protein